jgi:two-component system nitrate/nitrite response regulator NarL
VGQQTQSPIRVLIIDEHRIIRAGLRLLLGTEPGIQVVGEASNRAEGLAVIASKQVDIILLELDLGLESGLDLIPVLLSAVSHARIIILTGLNDLEKQSRAVQLGARGLVLKQDNVNDLITAIKKVHFEEVWFNPTISERLLRRIAQGVHYNGKSSPEKTKIAALTKREIEIIPYVCEGLKNHIIANRLYMSEGTLRNHLSSIYSKLGVTDRVELIIFAYRHKLAASPHLSESSF